MNTSAPTQHSNPASNPLHGLTVDSVATAGVLAVPPDASLSTVVDLMTTNRIHAVMVVDDEAPEPPVIRDVDVVAAAVSGKFEELNAGDIAGTEAVSVKGDDPLERAAELLAEHGVTHLIVRDRRRFPVGVLSTFDVAAAIHGRKATLR